jgi:hypothetical protein
VPGSRLLGTLWEGRDFILSRWIRADEGTEYELQERTISETSYEEDRCGTGARLAETDEGQRRVYRLEKRRLERTWAESLKFEISYGDWLISVLRINA